jgi:hypothetical protein
MRTGLAAGNSESVLRFGLRERARARVRGEKCFRLTPLLDGWSPTNQYRLLMTQQGLLVLARVAMVVLTVVSLHAARQAL